MGIENMVNIIFKGQQDTSITRLERGNVALLLQDREQEVGQFIIKDYTEIPKGLNEKNKKAIRLVLDTGANKVIAVITKLTTVVTWNPETDEIFKKMDALDFDFLALPGITNQDALKVASWAKKANEKARHRFKVVLPKTAGDDEHIINFAHDNIMYKGEKYKTEDFTAYIAGFIAKTEPTRSITNAKAIGVDSVDFMSNEEVNTATKEGKLVFYTDRGTVRFASGVNSLTTIEGTDKDESYKQIKIVEIMDAFYNATKQAILDKYIGKFSNNYQNKLLLVSELYKQLQEFEREGLVEKGDSAVAIDLEAQTAYLKAVSFKAKDGRDVDALTKDEILRANTREKVFIKIRMLPIGAIESVNIVVGA